MLKITDFGGEDAFLYKIGHAYKDNLGGIDPDLRSRLDERLMIYKRIQRQ